MLAMKISLKFVVSSFGNESLICFSPSYGFHFLNYLNPEFIIISVSVHFQFSFLPSCLFHLQL